MEPIRHSGQFIITDSNIEKPAGRLDSVDREIGIQVKSKLSDMNMFNDIVIKTYDDRKIRLGDVAEIIIGKQRNGPIGTKLLSFICKFTRFENYMAVNDNFGSPGGAPGTYGQAAMAPSTQAAQSTPKIPRDAFADNPFDEDD